MKILAAMITWNNIDFFRYSLEQALDFCDEVIVVEGCHSQQFPQRSTDGTVEYLKTFKHPKLRVLDVDYKKMGWEGERYDYIQYHIFNLINASFESWEPGNWIIQWDDDIFWFDKDLRRIREILEDTSYDRILFKERKFFYNFRFNAIADKGTAFNRITFNCYYMPLNHLFYQDGREYTANAQILPIEMFHYTHVKKSERMNARWIMSIEKGTKSSYSRFEKWMNISWSRDEDIFKHKKNLAFIAGTPPDSLNVFRSPPPDVLTNHPWRYVDDARKLK